MKDCEARGTLMATARTAQRPQTDRPTLADLQQEYATYRTTDKWKGKVRRSKFVWRSLGWTASAGPLVAHAVRFGSVHPVGLLSHWFRLAGGYPFPVRLYLLVPLWILAAPLAIAGWVVNGMRYISQSPVVLAVCLVALVYTLTTKILGDLCRAAGSRKAGKREPQHLFGYGSLYHEHWWNLIPVSPGTNWMENALLFGGHRSKRHRWRTFWRTVTAALIVRGWWVAVAFAAAGWYWSPAAVLGFLERAAGRL